ncbi:MAG: HAMP domain-containing histidine kinase [Lewinellaceae bacterium]|nr:HAMP domain-containing histidine kinase [Lewinellaceae bacterium]
MKPARHAVGQYLCIEMTKQHNNHLAMGLMVFSLAVLTAFLAFWSRQAYTEQRSLLQKEASHLFGNTVFQLQDSLIQEWVAQHETGLPKDSLQVSILKFSTDTMPGFIPPPTEGGHYIFSETRMETRIHRDSPRLERTTKGSDKEMGWIPGLLQNVLVKVRLRDSTAQLPFIEVDSTLALARLGQLFADSLKQSLAPLPFELTTSGHKPAARQALSTTPVASVISQGSSFQAHLSGYRPYLLRKIAPQLAFSLFLMALITLSFLLIFRNMQQQRRLADMRAGLVSNITHELKTPIATVSVAIEALENFNALGDKNRTREYLDISRNELHRLTILVDKVLNMAAFEKKELEMRPEPLDMKQLVEQACSYLKLHIEKMNATVQLQAEEGDYVIEGDRLHLTNVLYNLIDNALKYGGEKPEISLALHNSPESIQVVASDKGAGIPAEYQPRIFDQFFRVPQGNEHNIKGYGLGLSYVAKVVEKHGGKITVDSREGEGSRFTVRLPRHNK